MKPVNLLKINNEKVSQKIIEIIVDLNNDKILMTIFVYLYWAFLQIIAVQI